MAMPDTNNHSKPNNHFLYLWKSLNGCHSLIFELVEPRQSASVSNMIVAIARSPIVTNLEFQFTLLEIKKVIPTAIPNKGIDGEIIHLATYIFLCLIIPCLRSLARVASSSWVSRPESISLSASESDSSSRTLVLNCSNSRSFSAKSDLMRLVHSCGL